MNPELVQLGPVRRPHASAPRQHRRTSGRRHSARAAAAESQRDGPPRRGRSSSTRQNLLPAIFFIFSRVGCDQAVTQVLRSGVRLTDDRRSATRSARSSRSAAAPCSTRISRCSATGSGSTGSSAASPPTTPACCRPSRRSSRSSSRRSCVKVVFATETLALGINMPARTVVLEKLEKFNGEARVPITPGEYTQLTGRAGRRGIDVEGHSVIQWVDGLDPQAVASLASRRTYPLNSSFRPTYNMAVNLIEQFGRERTREILESSFAQFQADRAVVDLARKVRKQEESLAGYAKAMTCHLGDFTEYSAHPPRAERSRARSSARSNTDSRGRARTPPAPARRRCASGMQQHPCHACPDREAHARWAERWWRLKRETDQLSAQIRSRTGAVARIFDRVTDVLVELDYLRDRRDRRRSSLSADGRHAAAHLRRARPARGRVAAPRPLGRSWTRHPSPRWPRPSSTSRGATRASASDRYLPARRVPRGLRPDRRPVEPSSTTSSANTGSRAAEPLSTGLALAMYRWANGAQPRRGARSTPTSPPATSCAGRSRRSTCSTSSRSSPTGTSGAPRGRPSTRSDAASSRTASSPKLDPRDPDAGTDAEQRSRRRCRCRRSARRGAAVRARAGGFGRAAAVGRAARRCGIRPRARCRVPRQERLAARARGHRPRARHARRASDRQRPCSWVSSPVQRSTSRTSSGRALFLGPLPMSALAVLESLFFAARRRRRSRSPTAGCRGRGPSALGRLGLLPVVVAGLWTAREAWASVWPYGGFSWGRVAFSQSESPFAPLFSLARRLRRELRHGRARRARASSRCDSGARARDPSVR